MGQWGDVPWRCPHHVPPCRSQEARQAENTCTLADLPEGQVGKLLVRKSGKVQLVLGKVTLDVTMGTPCSFLQVGGGAGDPIPEIAPGGGSWDQWGEQGCAVALGMGVAAGEGSCSCVPLLPTPWGHLLQDMPPQSRQGPRFFLPPVVKGFPMGMGYSRVSPPSGTGAGVCRHRGQPDGRDDRPGPREAQAGVFPGL